MRPRSIVDLSKGLVASPTRGLSWLGCRQEKQDGVTLCRQEGLDSAPAFTRLSCLLAAGIEDQSTRKVAVHHLVAEAAAPLDLTANSSHIFTPHWSFFSPDSMYGTQLAVAQHLSQNRSAVLAVGV